MIKDDFKYNKNNALVFGGVGNNLYKKYNINLPQNPTYTHNQGYYQSINFIEEIKEM